MHGGEKQICKPCFTFFDYYDVVCCVMIRAGALQLIAQYIAHSHFKSWVMQHHAHCTTLNIVMSFIKHRVHVWGEVCWGSFDTGRWTEECCYAGTMDQRKMRNCQLLSHLTTHIPCHLPSPEPELCQLPISISGTVHFSFHLQQQRIKFYLSFSFSSTKQINK